MLAWSFKVSWTQQGLRLDAFCFPGLFVVSGLSAEPFC